MKKRKGLFSYANIVASLALFLSVSGGVVYAANNLGKNSVKNKNIAAAAVKNRNLAANAVTTGKVKKEAITPAKVKKESLTRKQLSATTLAGLQVAEFQSTSVPGLTTDAPEEGIGAPVPLTGTAAFTPVAGKSYELLVELKGTPTDAELPEGGSCFVSVELFVNNVPFATVSLFHSSTGTPPFNLRPFDSASLPIGLLSAGQAQTVTAAARGSSDCSAATTAALRGVVVQFG